MATELSRTYDTGQGAVYLQVQDTLGNTSQHTIYVMNTPSVDAAVAAILTATDTATAAIQTKFQAAGWTP